MQKIVTLTKFNDLNIHSPYKYRTNQKQNGVVVIYNAVLVRSEADAINLNRILPILILFYLYINILHLFFINCEVWKFSKIRPMYDKCMTKMITFAADKTS